MENLFNFEHFLHTWKLPKSSVYLVFDRLNNSNLVFATTDCRLRSCHFHSAFCNVINKLGDGGSRGACDRKLYALSGRFVKFRNKNRRQNPVWEFTKTIIPFTLVEYEVIITNSRYALVGYFITSYPTRAHGIIVIYSLIFFKTKKQRKQNGVIRKPLLC